MQVSRTVDAPKGRRVGNGDLAHVEQRPARGARARSPRSKASASTGEATAGPPGPVERLSPVGAWRRPRRGRPSPSRTATTVSALAGWQVAGQHDHDIVAGRGQRREQPAERALAGVAVGDGPVEAERREPFEVAADGQDLGGAGGAQARRRHGRPWRGRRPRRRPCRSPCGCSCPPVSTAPVKGGSPTSGKLSRRSSCACPPCAAPVCPRPSGSRRRRPRRGRACGHRSRPPGGPAVQVGRRLGEDRARRSRRRR